GGICDVLGVDQLAPVAGMHPGQVGHVAGGHHAQPAQGQVVVGDGRRRGQRVNGDHGVPLSALQPVSGADGDAGVEPEVGQEPGDAVDGLVVPGDHGHVVGGQGPCAVVGGAVLADEGLRQVRSGGVEVHRVVPVDLGGLDLVVAVHWAVGTGGVEGEVVQRGDRLDGADTESVGGRQVQHL